MTAFYVTVLATSDTTLSVVPYLLVVPSDKLLPVKSNRIFTSDLKVLFKQNFML